jgi:hypothetical protein
MRPIPSLLFLLLASSSIAQSATTFTNPGTGVANNIFVSGNWNNGLPTAANPGTIAGDATFWPADTSGNGTGSTSAGPNVATGIDITVTSGTLSRVGDFIPEFTNCTINLQGGNLSNDGPGARVFRLSGTSVLTVGSGSTFTHDASRGMELQNDGAGTPAIVIDGGTLLGGFGSGDDTGVATSNTAYAFLTFTASGGLASFDALTWAAGVSLPYIDFVSGSSGVLDLGNGDSTLYQGLWDSGKLRVDGGNVGTFADHFVVTGTQLSLIPEPSIALLGGLGLLALLQRRR